MSKNVHAEQENEDGQLTIKQERLIEALLAGNSIQIAANVAGVSRKTADRWLQQPHIQKAYKAAQKEVFEASLTTLQLAMHDAVQTLIRHANSEETPAAAQIRAAQLLIEQGIALYKMSDLERQIAELRQLLKEKNT